MYDTWTGVDPCYGSAGRFRGAPYLMMASMYTTFETILSTSWYLRNILKLPSIDHVSLPG